MNMKLTAEKTKEKALIKAQWPVEKKDDLPLVFSPLLKKFSNLTHAFTTRQGGQSKPPFDSFNIGINHATDEITRQDARHNKVMLCQSLKIPAVDLTTAERLVHSTEVVMLETVGTPGEVDGIVTKMRLKPLYMTYADCVPVIIYDTAKHILCVVHAGWRGTAGGISQAAVQFMIKECDSQAGDLVAAVGPAIGSCCYPVGLDVVLALIPTFTNGLAVHREEIDAIACELKNLSVNQIASESSLATKHQLESITKRVWSLIDKLDLGGFFIKGDNQIHLDLKAINAYQMLSHNVSQVDVTNFCTSCQKDLFYSFRRSYVNQEGATGRQAAIACLL